MFDVLLLTMLPDSGPWNGSLTAVTAVGFRVWNGSLTAVTAAGFRVWNGALTAVTAGGLRAGIFQGSGLWDDWSFIDRRHTIHQVACGISRLRPHLTQRVAPCRCRKPADAHGPAAGERVPPPATPAASVAAAAAAEDASALAGSPPLPASSAPPPLPLPHASAAAAAAATAAHSVRAAAVVAGGAPPTGRCRCCCTGSQPTGVPQEWPRPTLNWSGSVCRRQCLVETAAAGARRIVWCGQQALSTWMQMPAGPTEQFLISTDGAGDHGCVPPGSQW